MPRNDNKLTLLLDNKLQPEQKKPVETWDSKKQFKKDKYDDEFPEL
jgi:hypothetical protein